MEHHHGRSILQKEAERTCVNSPLTQQFKSADEKDSKEELTEKERC